MQAAQGSWGEESRERRRVGAELGEGPRAAGRPGQLEHCLAPFVYVLDLRNVFVSYQHINFVCAQLPVLPSS